MKTEITKKNLPLVSVCMITYNHAAYIESAVDGIIKQNYRGPIELIIVNDNSPDDTNKIVHEILKKNHNNVKIRYYNNKENLGVMNNFYFALSLCRGKYIALCEGDDFWTDDEKLSIQIAVLENNASCSFSFHKSCKVKNNDEHTIYSIFPVKNKSGVVKAKEFFRMGGKATSSIVFRNLFTYNIIKINHSHGDFLLYLMFYEIGNGFYVNRIMSTYRGHILGISFGKGSLRYQKKRIEELYLETLLFKNKVVIKEIKYQIVYHAFYMLLQNRKKLQRNDFMKYFSIFIKSTGFFSVFLTFFRKWILLKSLLYE